MSESDEAYDARYLKVKKAAVERAQAKGETGSHTAGADRLPPGQTLTTKFPVLDLGSRPPITQEDFRLSITGEVENPITLDWTALVSLPKTVLPLDFHCVTRWSQFDIVWSGVRFVDLCEIVRPKPEARFVIQRGRDGYTTNVSMEDMTRPDILIAYELEGMPIPLEHGGPVRPIIPHLYAYKGSKFLNALIFSPVDRPGFWERRGYHNHADPWTEERFD